MTEWNYYEILNSTSNASFEELKSNYKQLILQCHPDKLQQDRNEENLSTDVDPNDINVDHTLTSSQQHDDAQFVIVNEAWSTLKDPVKRKKYDAELLLTKFQSHSNIFDHLTLDEMEMHESNSKDNSLDCNSGKISTEVIKNEDIAETFYTFNCRCGGQYVIDESTAVDNGIYSNRNRKKLNKNYKIAMTATTSPTTTTTSECSDYFTTSSIHNRTHNNNCSINCEDKAADINSSDGKSDNEMNNNEVMVECNECSLVIILSNVKKTSVLS